MNDAISHDAAADVVAVLAEAGLAAPDLACLVAKGDKRIYRAGSFVVQLWYGRRGGALGRSGAALDALAGVVAVPQLVYQNLARSTPPYQVQISTLLPGVTLEDAWPTLDTTTRRSLVQQLGALMAAMHDVCGGRVTALAALDGPTSWAARCRAELAARLERARRSPLVNAAALKRVAAYVERHEHLLDLPPLCLVHTDIHFGNVLVDGNTVTGLIDFELAEIGGRDRDAYMLIGDSVGHMMSGGSDNLDENATLQAVRWLQDAYPALYATPGFAQRQLLYLMLEPEGWNNSSIDPMAAGWIRALDGGWIERWFAA